MFRQQLSGSGIVSVCKDLYHEGFGTLSLISCIVIIRYRGIAPPIVQKTISTSVMFGVFDFYRRLIVQYKKEFIEYIFVYVW